MRPAPKAGRPELDEDYLILSTIHSAKGQEWEAVYVLNLVDGCIPSDMATGKPAQVDEERRLLYVAMTRAKQHLHLVAPARRGPMGATRCVRPPPVCDPFAEYFAWARPSLVCW